MYTLCVFMFTRARRPGELGKHNNRDVRYQEGTRRPGLVVYDKLSGHGTLVP